METLEFPVCLLEGPQKAESGKICTNRFLQLIKARGGDRISHTLTAKLKKEADHLCKPGPCASKSWTCTFFLYLGLGLMTLEAGQLEKIALVA